MKIFEKILFYLSVPKCAFCGEILSKEELGLCEKCKKLYYDAKSKNCSVCSKQLSECVCTNKYLESHFIHKHVKVFRYRSGEESPGNSLIYKLKRDNRRDVVEFLSAELTDAIKNSVKIDSDLIITSVPRRKAAKAKYGIDHAEKLGISVAKKLNCRYLKTLKSKAKSAQKKAESPEKRIENAKFSPINNKLELSGKTIILIDDIVTTGASIGACAFHLKSLGAKHIIAASVATAYRDVYTPPLKKDRF